MIYLILAILCSSSIALIFKYSESKNMNRFVITMFNYIGAAITAFVMLIIDFPETGSEGGSFTEVIIRSTNLFSKNSSIIWGVSIGLFSGILFFLGFIYYQKSVNENGVSLSGAFGKLGILVPMTLGMVLWKEIPLPLQWVGIVLAIASIVLVNNPFRSRTDKIRLSLLLLFLFNGLAEFSNKLFQNYTVTGYKNIFLLCVFSSAFLISFVVFRKKEIKLKREDVFTGLIVGLPNLFSSFFLIMALEGIKSSVVFPVFSAGSVVMIGLGGFFIFREKLKRKDIISLIMILLALILINIK
ncbi:MAG: EamA family transporter [Kosmotogaceae bacterium]